jgi:alkylation response protein AidB-like acyl-CoA dehydrogenase
MTTGAPVDLELSEEEAELRDNVRDVLTGICPPSVVRAVYEQKGAPAAIWEHMVELYWPGLAIPEEHGGLGMGFVELAVVAEQLGRATVPSPFLATVTQFAPAVTELGDDRQRADLLGRVAAGQLTGTLAVAERGRWSLDEVRATATATSDGWALAGTKEAVFDGATAEEVVVVARGDAGLGAFVVARGAVEVRPRRVVDPTLPIADLVLDGVVVAADRVLAEPGAAGVEQALDRTLQAATVALAMATAGTCRAIFDATLEYTKVREQYGKPIGSFQALKHRLADMYLAVERASSLCWFAALTIDEEDPRRAEAAHLAKAAVGECQRLVVGEGLQLHGGIGFTWEHDLHFLLKRAKAGDAMFGGAVSHRAALATMLGLTEGTAA